MLLDAFMDDNSSTLLTVAGDRSIKVWDVGILSNQTDNNSNIKVSVGVRVRVRVGVCLGLKLGLGLGLRSLILV
jgi:hypothetical protein